MLINSPIQWEPQKINEDLSLRVSVISQEKDWYDTQYTGIWYNCFESDDEVQEHPVTMLTRFDAGGFFELHGHPGGEEILVLKGSFTDETGIHTPGTFMLNPEGFIHLPYSDKGCLTFVKLRQHGGQNRQQVRKNIYELPWESSTIPQIQVKPLYEQTGFPEKGWIEGWEAGTALFNVVESVVKEIFVIEGTWTDELGNYPTGSWLRYPPGCAYSPSSATGCMVYVKTYPLDTTRFIVGKDFRHPENIDVGVAN